MLSTAGTGECSPSNAPMISGKKLEYMMATLTKNQNGLRHNYFTLLQVSLYSFQLKRFEDNFILILTFCHRGVQGVPLTFSKEMIK